MAPRKTINFLRNMFGNLYFLMFLNGFLLASLFYFKMQASYENNLFGSIKLNIDSRSKPGDTEDSIVVRSMNACNFLMKNRGSTFGSTPSLGLEADLFHPTSVDLMTARGACGSYAMVLARILQDQHFYVRIAQMKADGYYGAHNLVEAKTNTGWIILDPLYNICFIRPDGRLASFHDVQTNWSYYAHQVPANYDKRYHYEDVRYSNWDKIPVLSRAIKGVLRIFMSPEKAETFSLRTLFLRMYEVYLYIALLLYIPVFFMTMRIVVKTKIFPDKNIPLTFRNILKYLKVSITGRPASMDTVQSV
jgi:hypothetical protein